MNKKTIKKEQEIVFGIHPIIELLQAKKRSLHAIYTTKPFPKAWSQVEKLLPKHCIVQCVPKEALTKMAGTDDHQSVVGWASPFQYRKKDFDAQKQPFLVLIDGVQDTRNVGAIIRSAYCTGVNGIIICKKRGAPINASTIKASAGLAEHSDIYEAPSSAAAVQALKKWGYTIYVTALGGENLTSISYKKPLCVVIGNEAIGVSPEALSAGTKIMIPQREPDISYNASVAAGIVLFVIAQEIKSI